MPPETTTNTGAVAENANTTNTGVVEETATSNQTESGSTNTGTGNTAETPTATSANFSLGERDVTVIVKNASSDRPEDTVFKVNDSLYRGVYLIQDFLAISKDGINFEFQNMKCKYKANVKIDPGVYTKHIVISYGYNKQGDCIYQVTPEEQAKNVTVAVTPRAELHQTIGLNDLTVFNFIGFFIFGLLVMIAGWIHYIKRKKVLIYNKSR